MMAGIVLVNRWRLQCILFLAIPIAVLPFCAPLLKHKRQLLYAIDNKLSLHEHQCDDEDSSFGLYVHIPYCRRRCNYCDFAIVPIGSSSDDGGGGGQATRTAGFENMDANYKKAVLDEINVIGKTSTSSINNKKIRLRSIYFGGGTPSLAPLSTLSDIMHAVLKSEDAPFYLVDDAEVTIEMDPGTFDMTSLEAVKAMGFNRISLGVQSFDDNLLATMGRVHRSADVYRSIEMIGQVFGEDTNYSIDLISGVPGLTLAGWTETLHKAVRLDPQPMHMSLYDLQVEKGTTFGKWYGDAEENAVPDIPVHNNSTSRPDLPSAEDSAFMYCYASGYLRSKNYEHYEISSYAHVISSEEGSHRSKHNQIYWEYSGQWYSLGLGATSNINGVRYPRPRALSDYISWTEGLRRDFLEISPSQSGADNTKKPPWLDKGQEAIDDQSEDETDDLLDIVMTRLRTLEGLDLDWVAEHGKFGKTHVEAILRGFELALDLDLGARGTSVDGKYGYIRLNDPKGFLFSNNIISNIFVELSEL
mmetsp:Transcript_14572/g.31685  ORF Transcript_14572/g.31685 Transcript_14572/m.31685 type:complete len:530 (+) Transcript_14572:22-1611(+)